MQSHKKAPCGNHLNQATVLRKRGQSRFGTLATAGACAVATLWLATASVAQSPFSQPPSRSGTFTLPLPTPEPSRGGMSTRPGLTPPRPAAPLSPLRPIPGGEMPARPGEMPALPGELSAVPESPLPLPILPPRDGAPSRTGELPPQPVIMPPLTAAPTAPVPRATPFLLRTDLAVTLRVCQVLPVDGLTSGERLLNSRQAIQPGDCFLAEVIDPCPPYPILVGGTVTKITDPGRFGRPGYVSLQMTQLVQTDAGQTGYVPWRMDLADRRFATRMRRVLLTTLLGLEGAGTGASVGAQFSGGNMAFIGGGMGIGAIVGLGYASFQRGTEANLEPGDTFEIVVGSTHYRPVSREWQTILYPAADPSGGKKKKP